MTLANASAARNIGYIVAIVAFAATFVDALNGFAGLAQIQPFATKTFVTTLIDAKAALTATTEADIQGRLVNLQQMSLEMNLQLIDGQLEARRGEQVDLASQLLKTPDNLMLKKRMTEVQAVIDTLVQRRDLISCYLDTLRGYKRDCH